MREREPLPYYTAAEELGHALTHGLGLVLSLGGVATLVLASSLRGDVWHVVGCSVFGATLLLLYAASTFYHAVQAPRAKRVLQRLDHAAIFLLIAGTYTPFALVSLRGDWGFTLLALIWSLAIVGIALVSTIPHRMGRFTVGLYLAMGWLVVVVAEPMARAVPVGGLALLLAGGLAYSLGVVFYAWRGLPYNHVIWHVFVMAGSACHFSCVLRHVVPSAA